MALVSAPRTATGSDAVAPNKATSDRKVVDLFADQNLPEGKKTKINVEEDAWERIAPPPMGSYSLKLFPGNDTVIQNFDRKDKTKFDSYSINIEARVINSSDFDNVVTFATVSTRIGRGKEISTAAGLLVKLGYKLPDRELSDLEVAKYMVQALKKEPVINGNTLDWKASYQDDKGNWKNVFNTMTDFPANPEGGYDHVATITNSGGGRTEVTAKLYVKEWGGKGVEVKKAETPVVIVEEEKPAPAPVKAVGKPNGKVAPVKQQKVVEPVIEAEVGEVEEVEDEELLLEE